LLHSDRLDAVVAAASAYAASAALHDVDVPANAPRNGVPAPYVFDHVRALGM
jgi:hypothetical protein